MKVWLFRKWVYGACRGDDQEPVVARELAMSIGCSKSFQGSDQLDTSVKVIQSISCFTY
jgi:nucleotidyltransferase/DNA polymerase involved in DNA repair